MNTLPGKDPWKEIGVIQTKNFEIADTWDITIKDKHDVTNALLTVFAEKPNYIVAHNAQIEKNLIREYLPYPKFEERIFSPKNPAVQSLFDQDAIKKTWANDSDRVAACETFFMIYVADMWLETHA